MLSEPGQTPYDLRFEIFGFPVRVHPLFFIMPLLMMGQAAGGSGINVGVALLIGVAVFFVSILVHELGHTLAFRFYGIDSHIVLYLMGGLAIPNIGGWRGGRSKPQSPWSQIVISAAGPVAGLLLGCTFLVVGISLGGVFRFERIGIFPVPLLADLSEGAYRSPALWMFLNIGVYINFFWNFLNLVPVFPLDGGQIARQFFTMNDPWKGIINSLYLSLIVAGIVALWGFSTRSTFLGILFAMLAISNYQAIQMSGGGGYGGGRPW